MKIRNSQKQMLIANLITGLLLLLAGVFIIVFDVDVIENKKALIGLSFIPLGIALSLGLNLMLIKKYPKDMKPAVIAEKDERLIAVKDQASSTTFMILRWMLMLLFFGYTFAVPADIFETASWWTVFGFFFLSYVLQGVLYKVYYGKENPADSDKDK